MSTCLRFFYTISIESINHIHFFTLKFLSYFAKKLAMTKIVYLRKTTLLMNGMTEKQENRIRHRVIEACKNDLSHTMKLCTDSE